MSVAEAGIPAPLGRGDFKPTDAQNPKLMMEKAGHLFPEVIQKLMPRKYALPGGHSGLSPYLMSGVSSYLLAKRNFDISGSIDHVGRYGYRCFCELARHSVPTYFVGRELVVSLLSTDLPEMRLCDLKWPLPAMLFVLPDGLLKNPNGDSATTIAISRTTAGSAVPRLKDEPFELRTDSDKDVLSVMVVESTGAVSVWSHPISEEPVKVYNDDPWLDEFSVVYDQAGGKMEAEKRPITKSHQEFHTLCNRLGLLLMMVMTIRPALIEPQRIVRPSKMKKGKMLADLWSPNYVGREFRYARRADGPTGTHSSPRPHIRRGHIRLYEPSETNRWKVEKEVWIESILVGGTSV